MVAGFYSFLGFPRLGTADAIKNAVAKGVKDKLFGYCSGSAPVMGNDGKYQVPLSRVRFETVLSEDEIDLDTGFLMMPQALPVQVPVPTPTGPETPITTGEPSSGIVPTGSGGISGPLPTDGSAQRSIEFNFSADRDQLFTAWNAVANLADLAGKVNVTVRADSAKGFDRSKLQNGVLEPLRESNLIE